MRMLKPKNMLSKRNILLFVFFFVLTLHGFSQCAMCKAAVEANLAAGDTKGAGLNNGILYLMIFPYIAVMIFGLAWYFQQRKKSA